MTASNGNGPTVTLTNAQLDRIEDLQDAMLVLLANGRDLLSINYHARTFNDEELDGKLTADDINHLVRTAKEQHDRQRITDWCATPMPDDASEYTWTLVDLDDILNGNHEPEKPELLVRTDGLGLLYKARVHSIYAEPEAGKGWLALAASKEVIEAGGMVLYVDYEDTPANIVARLRNLGIPDDTISAGFRYVRPEEPITHEARDTLAFLVNGAGIFDLVVIDGVTEALAVEGLNMADNQDVAEFHKRLPKPFARAGAAVVLIDHVVKDREARGRYAIGAQSKLSGVDCAYRLDVIQPFGRGRDGKIKMTVTKDRPGHVRGIANESRVAIINLASQQDGRVTVKLEPPEQQTGGFRPTTLMSHVSQAIADAPGLSRNGVRQAVKGKHEAKDLALELLVAEGFIEARHEGQAIRHFPVKPFHADTDLAPSPQPRPNLAPANLTEPRPLAPSPIGEGRGANPEGDPNLAPPENPDIDRAERLLADHPEDAA